MIARTHVTDESAPRNPRVAVYWDFENIHLSVQPEEMFRDDDAPRRRDAEPPARGPEALVDVAAVMEFARSFGVVTLNRAYGNWVRFAMYRYHLLEHCIDLVQLFPRGRHAKNGADIRMAADMVEDLFRFGDITHVLIIGGDSDFIGVVQKLKEYGRWVIGMGTRVASNPYFIKSCNEFKLYENLVGAVRPDESDLKPAEPGAEAVDSPAAARALLVRVLKQQADATGDPFVGKSALRNLLVRANPGFDPQSFGMTFARFIDASRDIVDVQPGPNDQRIRLRDAAVGASAAAGTPARAGRTVLRKAARPADRPAPGAAAPDVPTPAEQGPATPAAAGVAQPAAPAEVPAAAVDAPAAVGPDAEAVYREMLRAHNHPLLAPGHRVAGLVGIYEVFQESPTKSFKNWAELEAALIDYSNDTGFPLSSGEARNLRIAAYLAGAVKRDEAGGEFRLHPEYGRSADEVVRQSDRRVLRWMRKDGLIEDLDALACLLYPPARRLDARKSLAETLAAAFAKDRPRSPSTPA